MSVCISLRALADQSNSNAVKRQAAILTMTGMVPVCIASLNPSERGSRMNSVYLLIIWSAFLNSPKHNHEGNIVVAYFHDKTACEFALVKVKESATYVNGVCVPQGIRPDPAKSGKFGGS